MFNINHIIFAILVAFCAAAEKMAFAFEVVRHGARAPYVDLGFNSFFSVAEGMLTPSGMRQRYLLGAYNRRRYISQFDLLSKEFNPEEV
jgi:hypothetical protein